MSDTYRERQAQPPGKPRDVTVTLSLPRRRESKLELYIMDFFRLHRNGLLTHLTRRDKIERFIDDNKALMRRMYGEFLDNIDAVRQTTQQSQGGRAFRRQGRSADVFAEDVPEFFSSDYHADDRRGESFFKLIRNRRQSSPGNANPNSDRVDSCESKVEIVTPFWANNSAGKVRAIVNTNEFSQAIHQEICTKQSTKRCGGDCGCEQKYKWHRLLAYDPDNDCRGIFMDWFLFPSCCSCRCNRI